MKANQAVIALACVALLGVLKADDVLYSQGPNNSGDSWASQNDTNSGGFGNYATAYDNFTLAADGTVTGVSWRGEFFNGPFDSPKGDITGFTVNFWADSSNAPGGLLASTFIAGAANEILVGGLRYDYSATVADFAASAGVQYWLSIVPDLGFLNGDGGAAVGDLDGDGPQWGWKPGTGGDARFYQDFFGDTIERETDLTFTLTGKTGKAASVPDSGVTLLYSGLAMAALALVRRRLAS